MTTNMKNILLHRAYPGAFAAFAFLLVVPGTGQAQTPPKQFFACYVPSSGVVYRIKEPGLKDACTGKKHVGFSWAQSTGGLTGLEYVTVNFTHTSSGFTKGVVETEATCPTGKLVIGGSSQIEGVDTSGGEEMTLMGGAPSSTTNAWKAQFFRSADRPTTVTVTAICAVG